MGGTSKIADIAEAILSHDPERRSNITRTLSETWWAVS